MRLLVAMMLFGMLVSTTHARTLAEVKARGVVSVCANPDALPYAHNGSDQPGFQIEIARTIAEALRVGLQVDWIVARMRAGLVDCDMLLDTIVDPDLSRGPVKLTRAYQRSGVALALRRGNDGVARFADLKPGTRIGVMVNSLASKLLNERGLATVPYAFESDMLADLASGSIDACAVSPASIAYYIHLQPDAGLRYTHAYDDEPQLAWTVAVGLRRTDDALVDAVNAALERMSADGTLARIYARYGVAYRKP